MNNEWNVAIDDNGKIRYRQIAARCIECGWEYYPSPRLQDGVCNDCRQALNYESFEWKLDN